MKNRNMLTFGLAAGLVALVGTCLIAKEKQSDAADKAKEKRQFRMPLDGAKNNAAGMTMGEKLAAMGSTGE